MRLIQARVRPGPAETARGVERLIQSGLALPFACKSWSYFLNPI